MKRGMEWNSESYLQNYDITFNEYESASPNSFDEFLHALKLASRFKGFHCSMPFHIPKNLKSLKGIRFSVNYNPNSIWIAINGSDDDAIVAAHNFIRNEWGLSNPPIPIPQEGRPRNIQATVFLGKHFDTEAESSSRALRQFLELLRFDVQEADEYRATTIPEKVKKQIERQDIYIGLVTGKRDHAWLTAEAAFAHGKDRHVIMVVEEGSDFNPTIQGRDYEQIRFPSKVVEKSFVGLMQEFHSLGISGL